MIARKRILILSFSYLNRDPRVNRQIRFLKDHYEVVCAGVGPPLIDGVATIAFAVTVDSEGNWSIAGIDVSDLDDGTITYTATATDTAGNTAEDQISADKDTSAEPLTLLADGDDSEDSEEGANDNDLLSFD